jgi:hypothetical protein
VVIENARDAGILVDQGGTLLVNREVQIKEPGEQGVSTSGGVRVQDGSTFLVNSPLSIDGSLGQGLVVMGNSHAVLASNGSAPVAIRGSHRNGLVVANNSSVVVQDGAVRAEIASGLANDLVCDSTSLITGTGNITYSPALVQCEHLLPSATDPTLW